MASLVVYVFFSDMYSSVDKKAPMVDFCFTVVIAVFWLSASAAWANGVITIKHGSDPNNFLFAKGELCGKNDNGVYEKTGISNCTMTEYPSFKEANVSIILGFLNFFLWASNLWFLYKETTWFSGSGSQPQPQQQTA